MSSASSAPSPDGAPSRPLRRHVVKVLAPQTVAHVPGQDPPTPTLYLADRLMVIGDPGPEIETQSVRPLAGQGAGSGPSTVREALASLSYSLGDAHTVEIRRPSQSRRSSRARADTGTVAESGAGPDSGTLQVSSFSITHSSSDVERPADAWEVLQHLRAHHPQLAKRVRLEHVVRPAGGYWNGIGGSWRGPDGIWQGVGDDGTGADWAGTGGYWPGTGGYWPGTGGYWPGTGGYWPGTGGYWPGTSVPKAEYNTPGLGGRLPVSVVLKDPSLRAHTLSRHPVVALPDSGLADHPWFRDGALWDDGTPKVIRSSELSTLPDTDTTSQPDEFSGARGKLFGHGTFIAGIIRQGCPEATLLPIPVISRVGTAAETEVLASLQRLLARHRAALEDNGNPRDVIDVLSLSIGYYPSHDEDDDDTVDGDDAEDLKALLESPIAELLRQFGDHGVLVVASVGNDATANRFLPAALAPPWTGEHDPAASLPIVSVGALNPDGTTIAMFSNGGSYTTTYRKGVSVVSTLPPTNSGTQPTFRISTKSGDRSTVDIDDYSQGFGVWSGTSFATPSLAADLAAALVELFGPESEGGDRLHDTSVASLKERAWCALSHVLALPPTRSAR